MSEHATVLEVAGPWSLATSRAFWEGFTPAALSGQDTGGPLRTVFLNEDGWTTVTAEVRQQGTAAHIAVAGTGDLEAAAAQVARFLALDVDARGWPAVGDRDPVIAAAQKELPGLRPCGFHSPYEAAAWSVLSQRVRMTQAARLRAGLLDSDGAFPAPDRLLNLDLDLPGRKLEYLHAVAGAALDGLLDGRALRELEPQAALARVRQIKGVGPFAAELIVLRGANHPDWLPENEPKLDEEIRFRYGPGATREQVAPSWRPFRTWAAVHLRALRERR